MKLNESHTHYYSDGSTVTITKVKDAPKTGEYKPTSIDKQKTEVDFKLVQTSPYYIVWKNGEGQTVNKRQLNKLQKEYTWTTDF